MLTKEEIKQLVEQAVEKILQGQIDKALEPYSALKAALESEDGDVAATKAAVKQLEGLFKDFQTSMEAKIQAAHRSAYAANGRYRGVFNDENEARAFGLYVLSRTLKESDAAPFLDIFKSDYKEIFERAIGSEPGNTPGIPTEFSSRMQSLIEQNGVFERNAFIMPMSSDKLTFQREKGGVTIYLLSRGNAPTESTPTYEAVTLDANEWGGIVYYPKTVSADSLVALAEMIARQFGDAFAKYTDIAGFVGDGTPGNLSVNGITTRLSTINGTDDGGGLVLGTGSAGDKWNNLAINDFEKLAGRLPTYAHAGAKWYCSHTFFYTVIAKLVNALGGNTAAIVAGEVRRQLLGFDVELVRQMPVTAGDSQIPCLFGDVSQSSTLGRREGVNIEESREYKFGERQVTVLGTKRVAINNHSLGDSSTAGPVMGLITPVAS